MSTSVEHNRAMAPRQIKLGDWLRLTLFDMLVLGTAVMLIASIGLTMILTSDGGSGPQIVYFQRGDSGRENIWVAYANDPDSARRLTDAENPILEFDMHPGGQQLVFSMRDRTTTRAELYLMDMRSRAITPLTNCATQDADCTAPVFRANGDLLAYQRVDFNSDLGLGVSPARIWLLDLSTEPPSTYPLIDDSQVLGHSPIWSADGSRLAFYDNGSGGIIVYNFEANEAAGENPIAFIPTATGLTGSFAPDGNALVFPELVFEENAPVRAHLQIADLEDGVFRVLSDPGEQVDDQQAVWGPSGEYIAIGRDYAETNQPGTQIYLYDTEDATIDPLLVDEQYDHGFMQWSADGEWLTMTRFQRFDQFGNYFTEGVLEVWTYNLPERRLYKIAENARMPAWIP